MTKAREAVAVFRTAGDLEDAIDELETAGFDRAAISLLASEKAVAEKLGRHYTRTESLEGDPAAPRVAFVSTASVGDAEGALIGGLIYVGALAAAGAVVATGGAMAAAIGAATAAGGASGIVGTALAAYVADHHARFLQEQLERGGILLWVQVRDAAMEKKALEVLSRHSTHDVHVHEIPAGA